jgi:hypothetical protein
MQKMRSKKVPNAITVKCSHPYLEYFAGDGFSVQLSVLF